MLVYSNLKIYPKLQTKVKAKMLVTQSCPTLYNPLDCSLPGSSVHGILQARLLEWVAIPFSNNLPNLGNLDLPLCRQFLQRQLQTTHGHVFCGLKQLFTDLSIK